MRLDILKTNFNFRINKLIEDNILIIKHGYKAIFNKILNMDNKVLNLTFNNYKNDLFKGFDNIENYEYSITKFINIFIKKSETYYYNFREQNNSFISKNKIDSDKYKSEILNLDNLLKLIIDKELSIIKDINSNKYNIKKINLNNFYKITLSKLDSKFNILPNNKKIKLILDDIRSLEDIKNTLKRRQIPTDIYDDLDNIIIVRNYYEFINLINKRGDEIEFISFDHDLGNFNDNNSNSKEYTGKTCAEYMINYCLDNLIKFPKYIVHSDNIVGGENIIYLIENYKKKIENNIFNLINN